jgi:hypothetical protein
MSNAPTIDMNKWGGRAAGPEDISRVEFNDPRGLRPIVITVSADDIAEQFTRSADRFGNCDPNVFRQFLLERFKAAGAPVEGTLLLKLAHGAIARVKPDTLAPQAYFKYMWLSAEYAVAIASGGTGVA